jgi:hypothetical protein
MHSQCTIAGRKFVSHRAGRGYVVLGGDVRLPLAPRITAIPFAGI